jgi:hypothetical protein
MLSVYIITHFATFFDTPGRPTRKFSASPGCHCLRGVRSQRPNVRLIARSAARMCLDFTRESPAGLSKVRSFTIGASSMSSHLGNVLRSRENVLRAVGGAVLFERTMYRRSSSGSEGLPSLGVPYFCLNALQTPRIMRSRDRGGLCHIAPVFLISGLGMTRKCEYISG